MHACLVCWLLDGCQQEGMHLVMPLVPPSWMDRSSNKAARIHVQIDGVAAGVAAAVLAGEEEGHVDMPERGGGAGDAA